MSLLYFWGNCGRMKEKKRMWKNKGRKREELKGIEGVLRGFSSH